MMHCSRKTGVRVAVALLSLALISGLSIVGYTAAQQQKTATLTLGVQPQLLLVEQDPNVILKIRLAHGVTAQLWANNSCGSPKNNAMTFTASGTYTISIQSIKGHGELYACVLSSDGLQHATLAIRYSTGSTQTTLTSSQNPSVFGQSVTFTASVGSSDGGTGTPTGTVSFQDGRNTIGTGTLNGSGVATFATTALSVSAHSITAIYSGNHCCPN